MDQRQFARITFIKVCQLKVAAQQLDVEVQDISLKGALISLINKYETALNLEQHENISDITLSMHFNDHIHINLPVQIKYIKDDLIGLHFFDIDIDSLTNLKRLMALNLGSELLMERELESLIDYHQK